MDDRAAQFFVSVGRLCGDARVGGLVVRLTLVSGQEVVGVPAPPRATEGADELDGTGYADVLAVDGVAVPLSDVVEASVAHPERRRAREREGSGAWLAAQGPEESVTPARGSLERRRDGIS
jgi:hypothetical protein